MKRVIPLLLACMLLCCTVCAADVRDVLEDTAACLTSTVKQPAVGSIGGEWLVLGLARSEIQPPDGYFDGYYNRVCAKLRETGGQLHERKYTEYARVVLALTAIGKNPANVDGYNLLAYLGNYERVIWQGMNGPIFALLALDSGAYEIPYCEGAETQATRELYVNYILEGQTETGGFALVSGGRPDVDLTAMALQALANYRGNAAVAAAVERALGFLSASQKAHGGFESMQQDNLESGAQVLTALTMLDISIEDARFVKNGRSVLDNLLSHYSKGKGFSHAVDDGAFNLLSTEQAFYALVAYDRQIRQKSALYTMSDVVISTEHPDASSRPKETPGAGKGFSDLQGHPYQAEIEALAACGIVNGKTEQLFVPASTMTRAEFAAMITRALKLTPSTEQVFEDVLAQDWYFGYVSAAHRAGILNGISPTIFLPNGTITRQEAAVMTARAAVRCGIDAVWNDAAIQNLLAQFDDYRTVAAWAEEALAFCYDKGMLSQDVLRIEPTQPVKRDEVAHMLYRLLYIADLL